MILGTIESLESGEGVTLIIDGETTATTMKYTFLSSYSPVAGDRVLIEEISDTYVVLGKLVDTPEAGSGDTAEQAIKDGSGNVITSFYGHGIQAGTTTDIVQLVDASGTVLSSVTVNREEEAKGVKNWFNTSLSGSAYTIEFKTDVASYSSASKIYWRTRSGSSRGNWKELANA